MIVAGAVSEPVELEPQAVGPAEALEVAQEVEPGILQKSIYNAAVKEAFFKADHAQRMEMFIETLASLTPENAFDHTQPRLFSFGHQGIYSVQPQASVDTFDRSDSRLFALESIVAGHLGSHGIGPLLQLLSELINERVELYTQLKVTEIKANALQVVSESCVPKVTVNLRASDWMFPEIQAAVREACTTAQSRITFEWTEYADDKHFDKFFPPQEGMSLGDRLEAGLLPVFKQLVEEGVEIWADDVKPTSVYAYEDAASRKSGIRLCEMHCTVWELVKKPCWREIFSGYKLGIDFLIHAMRVTKDSGPDFSKVAIHAFSVKTKKEYVAAVLDEEVPSTEEQQAEQLARLQKSARETLREICDELGDTPVVLECTIPAGGLHVVGLQDRMNLFEQGALLHEAKLPTFMYCSRPSEAAILSPRSQAERRDRLAATLRGEAGDPEEEAEEEPTWTSMCSSQ